MEHPLTFSERQFSLTHISHLVGILLLLGLHRGIPDWFVVCGITYIITTATWGNYVTVAEWDSLVAYTGVENHQSIATMNTVCHIVIPAALLAGISLRTPILYTTPATCVLSGLFVLSFSSLYLLLFTRGVVFSYGLRENHKKRNFYWISSTATWFILAVVGSLMVVA
ncbi:MAG: hypothetical protein CL902_00675 [Dehalococcoidia bacterium]|nr:hypothetical protein [Dehalococcoidia bacterium]